MLLPVDGQASWCIYHFLDLIEHCFRRRAVGSHLLFVLNRRSTALTRKKKVECHDQRYKIHNWQGDHNIGLKSAGQNKERK